MKTLLKFLISNVHFSLTIYNWLDKRFSHLETEHDKIEFLKLNFGLNDNEAFYLSDRFFDLDPKVNLIKKQIINSLPDRLIRDEENDNKINKDMRLR